jgi:hypothetical protein
MALNITSTYSARIETRRVENRAQCSSQMIGGCCIDCLIQTLALHDGLNTLGRG